MTNLEILENLVNEANKHHCYDLDMVLEIVSRDDNSITIDVINTDDDDTVATAEINVAGIFQDESMINVAMIDVTGKVYDLRTIGNNAHTLVAILFC